MVLKDDNVTVVMVTVVVLYAVLMCPVCGAKPDLGVVQSIFGKGYFHIWAWLNFVFSLRQRISNV